MKTEREIVVYEGGSWRRAGPTWVEWATDVFLRVPVSAITK